MNTLPIRVAAVGASGDRQSRRETMYARCAIVSPSCSRPGDGPVTSSTVVWFGALNPPSRRWQSLSPRSWTCVGLLAIPLWATWPALSLQTWQMPTFECLAIVFLVGSLVLSRLEKPVALSPSAAASVRSWIPALAFAFGSAGSAVFFLLATHYIPAAEANLVLYLWPAMIVGLGVLVGVFRLRLRYLAGIALGFAGAAVLIKGGTFSASYVGVGLALLGGLSWALYCLFRLKWYRESGPLLARGFLLSALLCGVTHLLLESTVVPNLGSVVAAAAIGIMPAALANWVWDMGFRRGDSQLLAVMAYATPLCSALLLLALGIESFTPALLVGALLIVTAGFLSHAES